ncbi:hypothetical protein G6S93_004420 [Salmonella enterica]|nr:hypothetical protein [Salmonella enterica]
MATMKFSFTVEGIKAALTAAVNERRAAALELFEGVPFAGATANELVDLALASMEIFPDATGLNCVVKCPERFGAIVLTLKDDQPLDGDYNHGEIVAAANMGLYGVLASSAEEAKA